VLALQAGVVAAPREAPRLAIAERLRGPAWALVPIGSIVLVIFAIRYASGTATWLTWLALVAVPPLAAAALGWAMHGARPIYALGAIPLFALAWASKTTLIGEGSAALLSALSCVTLGVLLASVTPAGWLKIGIVLMACADSWLVVSDILQAPNASLVAAHPPAGLPQLQSVLFGSISFGYGDLFVAGLLGAVLASEPHLQKGAAALVLALAALFDLLFFFVSELPATVPVAVTVILLELWGWRRRRGTSANGDRPARRLLQYLGRLLGRARVQLDQQMHHDPLLVVLVETHVGEELTRPVIAERGVRESVARLRA
jgi:hypothetical protein